MKKLLIFVISLLSLLTLFGCSDDDGIPEGMQLVRGGDDIGYYFYGPEGWEISNLGEIDATYASSVDNSSASFARVDSSSFPLSENESAEDYFFNEYFNDSLQEFPENVRPTGVKGKTHVFGAEDAKADRAAQYIYEYKYSTTSSNGTEASGVTVGFMQFLIMNDGEFYIFTYSAPKAKLRPTDEQTRYDFHLERAYQMVDNFRFVQKTESAPSDEPNYEKDADGYYLASDKDLSGFELYLPEEFKLDYASAVVSATHSDGSNINISITSSTGVQRDVYWENRQKELKEIVSDFEVLNIDNNASLGNNSQWAASYEYTYEYNGTKFHVYQIVAVDGFFNFADGYVFTYTASEENYQKHFSAVEKIIRKVTF